MRILKITLIIFLALLIVSSIGGYIYFKAKFSPPDNTLNLSAHTDSIPITWMEDENSSISALLLPMKLHGIPEIFYLQFDLGSHSTIFYSNALQSVWERYPEAEFVSEAENQIKDVTFTLGNIKVMAPILRTINRGNEIKWNDSIAINIIGTLGSDILEHKVTVFDFKDDLIYFGNVFPQSIPVQDQVDFEFDQRKVLLSASVNGEPTKLYYDSGSSAFELLTDKDRWNEYALAGAEEETYIANSWGKPLTVHNIASDGIIQFGKTSISLKQVTYIEGTTFIQTALMKLSGMGGMIGNKIFMDKVLVLDARNEKFAILEADE
ncbi:hypothetical protein JKA74_03915 [Marivirga sp. S37H4]|uniref:Uncharacterized protein n=1 Tax=Marivirga aurantiaca TaxID=2802615 RepID=A0A934WWE5_9BACT|nr:hypothetical protein [Marivirga aurantiaca]MBK6264172.1 hypothetical protein [Marivirga aurantiaca]